MEKEVKDKSIEFKFIDKLNMGGILQEKLWNRNFILIMQGQMVSVFGDNIYEIALGF